MGTSLHIECPSCHTVQALAQDLRPRDNPKLIAHARHTDTLQVANQCHICLKPFMLHAYVVPLLRLEQTQKE